MTYNVLAINPGHNGSAALVCDGKLEIYIEEERMSRQKYDGNPFKAMMYIIERYHNNEFRGQCRDLHHGEMSKCHLILSLKYIRKINYEKHWKSTQLILYEGAFDDE